MTLRTRLAKLEAEAAAEDEAPPVDVAAILHAGRRGEIPPCKLMTQAEVDEMAKTERGRELIAARCRVGRVPPGLQLPAQRVRQKLHQWKPSRA